MSTAVKEPFQTLKERHLLALLVHQLAHSQFDQANQQLTHRLWEEVACLELDPDRVIHLLHSGEDVDNDTALCAEDVRHELGLAEQRVQKRGGWQHSGLLAHVEDWIQQRSR